MGALYGMGPTFTQQVGFDTAGISLFLGLPAVGALVLQWPLGWLSDLVDRQGVIILSAAGAAVTSIFLATSTDNSSIFLYGMAFFFGGLAFPAYSLCIAHINDFLSEESFLAAASGLILVYGVGAAIGPFLASLVMGQTGPEGLFWIIFPIEILYLLFAFYRLPKRAPILHKFKEELVHLPLTSHVIYQMDRRGRGKPKGKVSAPK